jgi:hypothetical protein
MYAYDVYMFYSTKLGIFGELICLISRLEPMPQEPEELLTANKVENKEQKREKRPAKVRKQPEKKEKEKTLPNGFKNEW